MVSFDWFKKFFGKKGSGALDQFSTQLTVSPFQFRNIQTSVVQDMQKRLDERINLINTHKNKSEYKPQKQNKSSIMANAKLKLLPPYSLYHSYFYTFETLRGIIDDIASRAVALGSNFYDPFGYPATLVKEEFERRYGAMYDFVSQATIHLYTMGQIIDSKFQLRSESGTSFFFRLIPSSETNQYYVDEYQRPEDQIRQFRWYGNDIVLDKYIPLFDGNGDRNFYFIRFADGGLFVGSSKIESVRRVVDSVIAEDKDYQTRLRNFGFSPIVAAVADESMRAQVESALRSMRDYENRGSVQVISGAVDSEGNPKVQFMPFKTEVEHRLDVNDKRDADRKVANALGYPAILLSLSNGGLSSGAEMENALTNLNESVILPLTYTLEHLANSFRVKEGLRQMEKDEWFLKMFNERKIQIVDPKTGERKVAHAEDFTWRMNKMNVLTQKTRWELSIQAYDKGLMTAEDAKLFAGMNEEEVADDDKHRKLRIGDTIIKEGELQEGVADTDTDNTILDSDNEDIADERTQGVENTEEDVVEDFVNNSKTKSIVNNILPKIRLQVSDRSKEEIFGSKKYKKFRKDVLEDHAKSVEEYNKKENKQVNPDDISKVPSLTRVPKAQEFKRQLEKALIKQYNILINTAFDKVLGEKQKAQLDNFSVILEKAQQLMADLLLDNVDFINSMQFFARMGSDEARKEAEKAKIELKQENREAIIITVNSWIEERTRNLIFGLPSGVQTDSSDIRNPYYDGSLSDTSVRDVALILLSLIDEFPGSTDAEIIQMAKEKLKKQAKIRAELITEDNLNKSYSIGNWATALALIPKRKEWLRTISARPRASHLETVGQTIGFDEYFTHGDGSVEFWSQTSINCKCSVRVIYV